MRGFVFFLGTPAPGEHPSQTYRAIIERAQFADALGYYGAWVAEHHFVPNYALVANPLLLAVAIARATRRIRVGAASIVVPLHNPVRVAEDILMLDWLSDGRAEVAFARGDHPYEYEALGIDYGETHRRFSDGIATICRVLRRNGTGETTPSGVALLDMPAPLRTPHPPLWVTAGSAGSIGMALEHGLNVAVSAGADARTRLPQMRQAFLAECTRLGQDPAVPRLGLLCTVALADTDEERARAIAGSEFIATMATTLRDPGRNSDPATATPVRIDPQRYFAGHPIGSAAHIADQFDWYRSQGVTDLILMFPRTLSEARARDAMQAVAELLGGVADAVPAQAMA